MILQTLLVSKDDLTAETLIQVLTQFGVAVDRSNAPDVAVTRLAEERFDQVIVDFDDPEAASLVLEACRRLAGPDRNPPVTVALLPDASADSFHPRRRRSLHPYQAGHPGTGAKHPACCDGAAETRTTAIVAGRRPGSNFDSYRGWQCGGGHPARPEHRWHGRPGCQATSFRCGGSRLLSNFPIAALALKATRKLHGAPQRSSRPALPRHGAP
jgi:CheY-like chemotaxis protein